MADIRLTNGNDKYEHVQGANWDNIYGLDGDDELKVNQNGALIGGTLISHWALPWMAGVPETL